VHDESQQTPSTHAPEPHDSLVVHAVPVTLAHRPAVAGRLHFSVDAQELDPQQTPSTHVNPAHAALDVHGCPRPGAGTHADALHTNPAEQSAFTLQVVLQVVDPHPYAPHAFGTSLH
jgi:hypothetical protein